MTEEESDRYEKAVCEVMRENGPLKREGSGADVAEAACYLASDRSLYVTGTILRVDAGTVPGQPIRRRRRSTATPAQITT